MSPSVYGRKIVCVWCEDFGALCQYKGLVAKHILLEKPIVDLTNSEITTIILKMTYNNTHTFFLESNPFDFIKHFLPNKVYASPVIGT